MKKKKYSQSRRNSFFRDWWVNCRTRRSQRQKLPQLSQEDHLWERFHPWALPAAQAKRKDVRQLAIRLTSTYFQSKIQEETPQKVEHNPNHWNLLGNRTQTQLTNQCLLRMRSSQSRRALHRSSGTSSPRSRSQRQQTQTDSKVPQQNKKKVKYKMKT